MESAEQLLENLNRQFLSGDPAAVLLRTISALESAIRNHPPARVTDTAQPLVSVIMPQVDPRVTRLKEPPVVQVLDVDEAEVEEELRALREAAELRQERLQYLRPNLVQSTDEPHPPPKVSLPAVDAPILTPLQSKQVPVIPAPSSANSVAAPPLEINESVSLPVASLNDSYRMEASSSDHPKFMEPVADLRKAIAINDRFRFVNELFRGDAEAFSQALLTLNRFGHFAEAAQWLESYLRPLGKWDRENPAVRDFLQLLERRYP